MYNKKIIREIQEFERAKIIHVILNFNFIPLQ